MIGQIPLAKAWLKTNRCGGRVNELTFKWRIKLDGGRKQKKILAYIYFSCFYAAGFELSQLMSHLLLKLIAT